MGVMDMIANAKAKFRMKQSGVKTYEGNEAQQRAFELQRLRAETLKAEGIARLKREEAMLRERKVKAEGPSKMQRFGKGLQKVMNKGKQAYKKHQSKMKLRAIPSSGSRGLDNVSQGSPFGGQRNLDVGGSSSGGFSFGSTPKPMPKKKEGTTIIIKTQ